MSIINGRQVGGGAPLKTMTFVDENGVELLGIVVDKEVIFDATDNDVRSGVVYASDDGVSTGTKYIPSYHTTEGKRAIPDGSQCLIYLPDYGYTSLQAIICTFNTNMDDSTAAEQVVIQDGVYNVQSSDILSTITVDEENQCIDLGITNTSGKTCIIRYFTYKEIY